MKEIKLSPIKAQKKSDAAYQILFDKIIGKDFFPGQRLDLSSIETQLGISRMPLRLALNRLEHEGLVEIVPQSGTFVSSSSSKDSADSFDIRIVLECYAIDLAIKRITDKDLIKLQGFITEMEELIQTENWNSIYQPYMLIDTNFHKELAIIAGNKRLIKAVEQENKHIQGSRKLFDYPKDDLVETIGEHKKILEGLSERDVIKANNAMSNHLKRVKNSIIKLLDRQLK